MKSNVVTVPDEIIEKSIKLLKIIPKALLITSVFPLIVFSFPFFQSLPDSLKISLPIFFVCVSVVEFYIIKKVLNKKKLLKSVSLNGNRVEVSFYQDVLGVPLREYISCYKNDVTSVLSAKRNGIILNINLETDIIQIMVPPEVKDSVVGLLNI